MADLFAWIVTLVGCFGFWLGGKKIWWSWYVNIANQLAWIAFALISGFEAFLVGTAFYLVVFIRNAYLWTKNRNVKPDVFRPFGEVTHIYYEYNQMSEFRVNSYGRPPNLRPGDTAYYKE